ncbi:SURF1 family protein [Georgenia sp. H159]|uniref:SURF1 family protein n=1 Tax=Georgenia sp. H159 TaxID=3076115 RepID=UPI002D78D057|nr:SURF1 family protein [Georgenia sp. H159]
MSTSARPRADARDWLRAATTTRMVVLLLAVVVVAAVCTRLGLWQLDRAGIRGAEAARIEREELLAAPAVPVEEVLAPQSRFTGEHLGRRVSLQGSFDPAQQVLVPGRNVDGRDALLVVSAFHVDGGPHDGAIMPVLRGWLPEEGALADRLEAGAVTDGQVTAPAPPAGRLEVVGMLSDSEAAGDAGLPDGFAGGISAGELAGTWGTPMYSAYLVLEQPPQPGGLAPAPSPLEELDTDPNVQSLAYAVEWWAFALFAVVFWLKVLRDDVRERRLAGSGD